MDQTSINITPPDPPDHSMPTFERQELEFLKTYVRSSGVVVEGDVERVCVSLVPEEAMSANHPERVQWDGVHVVTHEEQVT